MKFEPSPEFIERSVLLEKSIACEKTDRLVVAPQIMYLPIYLYGKTTVREVMLDYAAAEESFYKYHQEFQPDLSWGPGSIFPGKTLEYLDCQYIRMPGGKYISDPNAVFQVVDREDGYMNPEEYLEYAEDPSGFMMRKILPRHYAALAPLGEVDFSNMFWQSGLYDMIPFGLPHVQEAFLKLFRAGADMMYTAQAQGKIMGTLAGMGFPSAMDGAFPAPFDVFNDVMRGFLNTTMDMLDCPDELLAAIEATTKIQVRKIRETFKQNPFAKQLICFVHNGFDMFMSREQFQTFYWPGLKACVETVIECGGTPRIYIEDKFDSKLDIIANDLPAGKCIVTLINCDVEKAKSLFQGKICLDGGISGVLLRYGTPEQVEKHVKETIDMWAPGGGYIVDCDVSLDVAKTENLHALYHTAKNYIKY